MDDTLPPPPPSSMTKYPPPTDTHPPQTHNIAMSPSVYPTPPLTAISTSGEHDRLPGPPPHTHPPATPSTHPRLLTTSEILALLLPLLMPVPIPLCWDLGFDAALRNLFVRIFGEPALFTLDGAGGTWSGDSGAATGGSFGDQGTGKSNGKGKERAEHGDVKELGAGEGSEGQGEDEGADGDEDEEDERNERAERVEVDVGEGLDVDMGGPEVRCSSSSSSITPKRRQEDRSSIVSRGRSNTRKPRASNPNPADFSKERMMTNRSKSTFSPVDWSKMESQSKTRVETSKAGARVLSLSPHARLILSPSSKRQSGPGVGTSNSISPSTSLRATIGKGAVSPANSSKSMSSPSSSMSSSPFSSPFSFTFLNRDRSPKVVTKSYTLPPQKEGSIAALREVALGNVFPDEVVFGSSRNGSRARGMDVDVDLGKDENESESEGGAGSCEEQQRHDNMVSGGEENTTMRNKGKQKVVSDPEPTDNEAASISGQARDVRHDGNSVSQNTEPVQRSLMEMGRMDSAMSSSSSLSTLTSLPSSSSMSSRAESPEKPSEFGRTPWVRSSVPASMPSSTSRIVDLKNIKFGPPKKKLATRLSVSPVKSSTPVTVPPARPRDASVPITTSPAKVSTLTSAGQTAELAQTPFVLSQSSQTTVEEESIAQDLIMTMSSQDVEQDSIDQFSSLVHASPSKKVAAGYTDDDISMGTSLGSYVEGVDSQIQSALETTPRRRGADQDEVGDDTPGSVPSSCSPAMMLKKTNENQQNVPQAPPSGQHSSPNFTSPVHNDANEYVPMHDDDDVNDEHDFHPSPEPPSETQSKRADHLSTPSPPPFQVDHSLSPLSDIASPILQAKRELDSPVPVPMAVGHAGDKKGKGKNVERKSIPPEDVISISSDSEDEDVRPKFTQKGKGKEKEKEKEKEKATPAFSDPTPSQQQQPPRPKPVPVKRKTVTKLNVFEKPPPEIVDLTTPVKEPTKTKPNGKGKGKGKEEAIPISPSPMAASSSLSVIRTRSSRMMVDDAGPRMQEVHQDVVEADQDQLQRPTRRPAPPKEKIVTPLAVKKYAAKLAADAEDSDDADIITVKKKKPAAKKAGGSSAGGDAANVKRDPDDDSGNVPPEAGPGGGKTRLMGILTGKGKQSGAMTRVKKRKRTPEPEDKDEDNEDGSVLVGKPPLKKARARNGSTVSASASVIEKETGRGKSKPLSKMKTESVKGKEKEAQSENRYSFRSPRKDPSLGGISSASVSTPKKKRGTVVWPTVKKPNFDLFVKCDDCDKWYHIGCVGMEPDDVRLRETERYCCPLCNVGITKEESPVKNTPSKASEEDNTDPRSRCSRRGCLRQTVKKHRGRKSQAEIQAMIELEKTFDVEAFVGRHKKVIGGQGITYEYLVKWLNYPFAESTWETIDNMGLTNPATLLEQFEQAAADEDIDLENASGDVVLLKAAAEAGWTEDRLFVKPETKG